MSKSNHTPTPWEAKGSGVYRGSDCIVICDTDNSTQNRYEANAAFIVTACNAHDNLVAALEKIATGETTVFDDELQDEVFVAMDEDEMSVIARAAIAKAGGDL